jgi:four helix bundle protein
MSNLLQVKSYEFALLSIDLYKNIVDKREFILSKQYLRCATSVGANIEEALGAQSKADFIAKLSIAYKEAREVKYWLNLLQYAKTITSEEHKVVLEKADELCRLLYTAKNKFNS